MLTTWYTAAVSTTTRGLVSTGLTHNNVFIEVSYRFLRRAAVILSKHSLFRADTLVDIVAYDTPECRKRFSVTYVLSSTRFQSRVRLRVCLQTLGSLITLCFLYECAKWMEREVTEMYGFRFLGHPDPRRLLLDYIDMVSPLRKDSPTTSASKSTEFSTLKMAIAAAAYVHKAVISQVETLQYVKTCAF